MKTCYLYTKSNQDFCKKIIETANMCNVKVVIFNDLVDLLCQDFSFCNATVIDKGEDCEECKSSIMREFKNVFYCKGCSVFSFDKKICYKEIFNFFSSSIFEQHIFYHSGSSCKILQYFFELMKVENPSYKDMFIAEIMISSKKQKKKTITIKEIKFVASCKELNSQTIIKKIRPTVLGYLQNFYGCINSKISTVDAINCLYQRAYFGVV